MSDGASVKLTSLTPCRENPIEDLGMELTFSTDDNAFGDFRTIDLKPNGQNIEVTDENKEEYVKYVEPCIIIVG